MENASLVTQAKQYLQERGYNGGYVLFYAGEQYGWKNALRNPESEKPGAIAIDSEGNQHQAVGGNDYDGAKKWVALNNTLKTVLYKKDSTGNLRQWSVEAKMNGLIIEYGAIDGAKQIITESIDKGLGGRLISEQVLSRYASRINKQRDKGYVDNKEQALQQKATNTLGLPLPMLAKAYTGNINDECFVQYKYNGHRCLVAKVGGELIAYSRNGKPIETIGHVLNDLAQVMSDGDILDGELYDHGTPLQEISSWVRKAQAATKNLFYVVYDVIQDKPYFERLNYLDSLNLSGNAILAGTRKKVYGRDIDELLTLAISRGYEGLIVRDSKAFYATGKRSSALQKIKKKQDAEFLVVDVKPSLTGWPVLHCEVTNDNQAPLKPGETFKVTAPGTTIEKAEVLQNKHNYIGRQVNVEYFEVTSGGKPFHPVATYFRDKE